MNDSVPPAIRTFVDATNAGDTEAFVANFTEDAHLEDFGRTFTGQDGAASWNSTDNIGMDAHFEFRSCTLEAEPDAYLLVVDVTSHRFSGTGNFHITVRDDQISRMVVAPALD